MDAAIRYLNEHYPREYIHPDYFRAHYYLEDK